MHRLAVSFWAAAEAVEKDMTLIDRSLTKCVLLKKQETRLENGSRKITYREGKRFNAALVFTKTAGKNAALAATGFDGYSVYLPLDTVLDYHDVFMRLSDKKTFRVTSNSEDAKPPEGASALIRYRMVTAEAFDCEVIKP